MADPHIQSPMDFWDYLTVLLYRSAFTLSASAMLILPYWENVAHVLLLVSGTLLAFSLHLYVKSIRLLFQLAMWVGLLCQIFEWGFLALGAVFVILGGLCYKEYFCFRIWGLNFQPVLLAALWLTRQFDFQTVEWLLSTVSGLLILFLSVKKWKMPLHFDVGDKQKYQI